MKTTVHLDYRAVLANTAQPVNLVLQFEAPAVAATRQRPVAFSLVLDRSGSMAGSPLEAARRAAHTVVQNLRRDDLFSLVVFDDVAQTILPLAPVVSRQQARSLIDRIGAGGSTNLSGGWMLGRDQLKAAPAGTLKRLLLLTDGQLNVGIVEPQLVKRVVSGGLEAEGIRTSCLGFGDGYNEDLLADLAKSTGGAFYDANQGDKLPGIFAAELDGLQKTVVVNLRVRMRVLGFVEGFSSLAEYTMVSLPDGRTEVQVGDLVSDEQRIVVFDLRVLPIPLVAPGVPAASLDGEALLEVEVVYDEISETGIASKSERHTIRVRPTQDPADVKVNETVLPWVSTQFAARVLEHAMTLRDAQDLEGARRVLEQGIANVKAYGNEKCTADAFHLLADALANVGDAEAYAVKRKMMRYSSSTMKRMRSSEHWVGEGPAPGFVKPPPGPTSPPAPPADQSTETPTK
jgi:Ca-activated chloride channel family protein